MTVIPELSHADPADLDGLRAALKAVDPEGRLKPIGMSRIDIGSDALPALPEIVAGLTRGERVVLLEDSTPMRRGDADLKTQVVHLLWERFQVHRKILGAGRAELHADETAVAEAEAAVENADCVVVVGSGTITDICKSATGGTAQQPLVVVQTAASVNAFSDDMAVLLRSGTKRTVPSRWPDALLVDLGTLAGAPPAMNLAGFGDLTSMWTAPADWYLANLLGMDGAYHAAPGAILRDHGRALLASASALRRRDTEALEQLARVLTLSGIVMGVAGKTAPLSGTEHLISHLIDMAAEQADRPLALHGAQVGVAVVPVAAAWELFLEEFDPSTVDVDRCFRDSSSMEPLVRAAFARIDPSGRIGEECWSDYRRKLARWHACRPTLCRFLESWQRIRGELAAMTISPTEIARALREAGAPTRFSQLSPPVSADIARWALSGCHLMRDRFTLADLLFFLGWWTDDLLDRLWERAGSLGADL